MSTLLYSKRAHTSASSFIQLIPWSYYTKEWWWLSGRVLAFGSKGPGSNPLDCCVHYPPPGLRQCLGNQVTVSLPTMFATRPGNLPSSVRGSLSRTEMNITLPRVLTDSGVLRQPSRGPGATLTFLSYYTTQHITQPTSDYSLFNSVHSESPQPDKSCDELTNCVLN